MAIARVGWKKSEEAGNCTGLTIRAIRGPGRDGGKPIQYSLTVTLHAPVLSPEIFLVAERYILLLVFRPATQASSCCKDGHMEAIAE